MYYSRGIPMYETGDEIIALEHMYGPLSSLMKRLLDDPLVAKLFIKYANRNTIEEIANTIIIPYVVNYLTNKHPEKKFTVYKRESVGFAALDSLLHSKSSKLNNDAILDLVSEEQKLIIDINADKEFNKKIAEAFDLSIDEVNTKPVSISILPCDNPAALMSMADVFMKM